MIDEREVAYQCLEELVRLMGEQPSDYIRIDSRSSCTLESKKTGLGEFIYTIEGEYKNRILAKDLQTVANMVSNYGEYEKLKENYCIKIDPQKCYQRIMEYMDFHQLKDPEVKKESHKEQGLLRKLLTQLQQRVYQLINKSS